MEPKQAVIAGNEANMATCWKHLDANGKKVVSGYRYQLTIGDKTISGRVTWTRKRGFVMYSGKHESSLIIPFRYAGNQVLIYESLVRENNK